MRDVASLEGALFVGDEPVASALDTHRLDPSRLVHRGDRASDVVLGNVDAQPQQVVERHPVADLLPRVEHHEPDLSDGPAHGRDRRDVQPLVDLGAPRVVDAGDHDRHLVVLARDAGRDDVRVVAARDRQEDVGIPDPGLLQDVPGEPEANEGLRVEAGRQPVERARALVDHGHRMAELGELDGQV